MSSASGPSIATNGLVLDFDAANLKSFGPFSVEALVVAGGGGAGGSFGGGGGGGGLIYNSAFSVTAGTAVTVTVGNGGAGGVGDAGKGTIGSNSIFSSLTAIGGGGGGAYSSPNTYSPGIIGGSGGGSATSETLGVIVGAAGTTGQGFAGGSGYGRNPYVSGGGGGAGAVGQDAQANSGGNGGNGLSFPISGLPTFYSGGGGGAGYTFANGSGFGVGGLGGGGAATGGNSTNGTAGTTNTGGGGGGAGYPSGTGGAGGSGVVIIRYPGLQKATGGTITSVGGYTVHTFTTVGSSTFTPGTNWADVSTGGNVGTLNNSPTYSSANGGALVFNGSNTWIESPTSAVFDTQTLTMESWCKPTVISQDGFLFEKGQVNTQYSNFFTTGNALIFRIIGLSTQDLTFSTSAYMTANTWNHIVCTYSAGVKTIYLNGAQIAQQTGLTGTIPTGQTNQYIGKYGAASNNYMFTGSIAVSKVYNRALSAAEVAQNFNATRSRYGL